MLRNTFLPLLLVLSACSAATSSEGETADRRPLAKADRIGSCVDTGCRGQAPGGTCYCDDGCVRFGDCCDDRAAVCGGMGSMPVGGSVPEFGASPTLTVLAEASDGLSVPRDLEFNPDAQNQLFTVNQATDAVVILHSPGEPSARADVRADAFGNHFMEEVSGLSFGEGGAFGTSQESRNTYNNVAFPNDFMGPAMWSSDLSILAKVNQNPNGELLGSHLDMLHQSPFGMGIEHHDQNQYWYVDGMNGHIVFYDFQQDHGPGYHDHSDGKVRRYVEVEVKRVANVPSHLYLEKSSGWLYIADTGNRRVLRMDTGTGAVDGYYQPRNEPLAEFARVRGVTVETFISAGLVAPSGIVMKDGRLFVSDFGTGDIIAFDGSGAELGRLATGAAGIMGLAVGPADGKLYYADGRDNLVVRVDP